MWVASRLAPTLDIPVLLRIGIAAMLAAAGVGAIVCSRVALARANTTWKPGTPEQTSCLVTTGVYRFTRNPIYLGILSILLGWAVALASPLALIFPAAFVFYMNRFQIALEERALSTISGAEYSDYVRHVRRWL